MEMRLIDADKVIEHLEKVVKDNPHFVDAAYIRGMQEVIKEQPTAYDIDKVVEQLKELKSQVPEELSQLMAYDESIEIVKKGIRKDISE